MSVPMTRVTVIEPDSKRRVDVPLPSQDPIIEHVPDLARSFSLLGASTDPRRWTLARPFGDQEIPPERSLSEAQVVDGAQLWLVPARGRSQPLLTEDVVEETKGVLDTEIDEWAGDVRKHGLTNIAALLIVSFALIAAFAPGGWAVQLGLAGIGAVAGTLATLAARDNTLMLASPVPSWAVAGYAAGAGLHLHHAGQFMLAATTAGIGLALFLLGRNSFHAVVAAGATLVALGIIGSAPLVAGLPMVAVCGVLLVLGLFTLGVAPQIALSQSSLVRLAREHEDGNSPTRGQVAESVHRGHQILVGVVAGTAVVLGVVEFGLSSARHNPLAIALTFVAAAAFALRARLFSRSGHILPLLLAAVFGVVVTALGIMNTFPGLGSWAGIGFLVVLTAILLIAARTTFNDVAAARTRRVLNGLDTAAVIAIPPLAFLAAGGIGWVQSLV
jgi:type VII secretion integral membrane protein EccD